MKIMVRSVRFVLCAAALVLLFSCAAGEAKKESAGKRPETKSPAAEIGKTPEEKHPLQTASFRKGTMAPSPTGYGGGEPFDRLERYPELPYLYAGSAFAKEYKEDRPHVYSWEDLLASKRVTEKTPGSCITCKTPAVGKIFAEQGWDYAKKKMPEFAAMNLGPVGCGSCHDPETLRLKVVQPAFREAMKARGVDVDAATHREMKTYVCAQCHSEYFFEPGTDRVIHPWGEGLSAAEAYGYYAKKPSGFEGDYVHPESKTRLLKAQHPDYEEYSAGIHAGAGVACADCHMPKQVSGGKKYSSHDIGSPLRTVESSCLFCHKGKTKDWMIERAKRIQDSTAEVQKACGEALVEAHKAVAEAAARGANAEALAKEHGRLRRAQWLWDWTASANSMGFHDSTGTLRNLSEALALAKDARIGAIGLK